MNLILRVYQCKLICILVLNKILRLFINSERYFWLIRSDRSHWHLLLRIELQHLAWIPLGDQHLQVDKFLLSQNGRIFLFRWFVFTWALGSVVITLPFRKNYLFNLKNWLHFYLILFIRLNLLSLCLLYWILLYLHIGNSLQLLDCGVTFRVIE